MSKSRGNPKPKNQKIHFIVAYSQNKNSDSSFAKYMTHTLTYPRYITHTHTHIHTVIRNVFGNGILAWHVFCLQSLWAPKNPPQKSKVEKKLKIKRCAFFIFLLSIYIQILYTTQYIYHIIYI